MAGNNKSPSPALRVWSYPVKRTMGWSLSPRIAFIPAILIVALVEAAAGHPASPVRFDDIAEHPGYGLEARAGTDAYRLGRPEWALADSTEAERISGDQSVVLTRNGIRLSDFRFEDRLRVDAAEAVADSGTLAFGSRSFPVTASTAVGSSPRNFASCTSQPYCPVGKPITSLASSIWSKSSDGR